MKTLFTFISAFLFSSLYAQHNEGLWHKEVRAFQTELNDKYSNPENSPLTKEDLKNFDGLSFFPPNDTFVVEAHFVRVVGARPFEMPTTSDRTPIYVKYGELNFNIKDSSYVLSVYQNVDTTASTEAKEYLFLPFNDLTNGVTTYGGGRYIDMKIPNGKKVWLDFNKAYNPYCAYNPKYSCPIPPEENSMPVAINAGVKAFEKH